MTRTTLSLTTVVLLSLALGTLSYGANSVPKKIGGNGPIDRPTNHTGAWCSNEWTFCPTALDSFVADGDSATVMFRVHNWYTNDPSKAIDYHLDNVVVVERSIYNANLGSLLGLEYPCMVEQTGTQALDFVPLLPGGVVYHTSFDGGIGPEWSYDPAQVTYSLQGTSGEDPMYDDPFNPSPSTTGNMDIGTGSDVEFVEVTLQLSGLSPGTEYVLSYWSSSRNDQVGSPGCPQPIEEQDDYEVTIYGETLVCAPDLPAITASEIRTLAWSPVTEIWTFQVKFQNVGVGPGEDIMCSLSSVPPTVTILENRVPIGYLGTDPRDEEAWAGDTFTLDMSNHTDPFAVVNFNYVFTDDCGDQSVVTSLTILGNPETYPTGAPRSRDAAWLEQNRPNPFNPSTVFPVNMPEAGRASLTVYDLQGRQVRVLHDGPLPEGRSSLVWNGRDDAGRGVGAGAYLARLRVGRRDQVRRIVLLK